MSIPLPGTAPVLGQANTAAVAPLSMFADLRFETDGHRMHLVGDGRSLVLHTSDPRRLIDDLRTLSLPIGIGSVTGRRAVGRTAEALRGLGLTVDVRGPDAVLVRLGDGVQSRVGRLVTGSGAVEFGAVRDVGTAFAGALPLTRISLAGVVALAIGVGLLRRRR